MKVALQDATKKRQAMIHAHAAQLDGSVRSPKERRVWTVMLEKRENRQVECIDCLKGIFQPEKAKNECPSCFVGQFTIDPGQTICSECDAGKRENNRIECLVCPKGFFQQEKSKDFCTSCSPGQYTDDGALASEMISCKECDAGKRENNRIECIACSKGFFQPSKGNDTCPSCPVGQFTADPSQTTCIECDAGKA